jgi:predicted permease
LKSGGSAGTSRGHHRLRAGFIITQVALAMVLLVISGLLVRNIISTRNADFGFDPRNLLTTEIGLATDQFKSRDMFADFYQPLLERVQHLPGVKSAGIIQVAPLDGYGWNSDIQIVGQPPAPPNEASVAEDRFVTPGYFDALGIKLVRGRLLDPAIDTMQSRLAIVVNEAFVKRFFPNGEDPIGKQLKGDEGITIVGVVKSIRQDIYTPSMPEMDYLASQTPKQYRSLVLSTMQLVIRTEGDPKSIIPPLRAAYKQVDPAVPFRDPLTMDDFISESLVFKRLQSWLFGIFASLALVLAVVGLYGLISQEVELSTREIGVRVALGAQRSTILNMVFRRVTTMLVAGVVVGVSLTFAAQRLIASVVELHSARDTSIIAMLAALMFVSGLLAAAPPARRAANIEPMTALRYD